MQVRLKVPDGYEGTKCKVYYVDNDGNMTDMNARYEDGYLVFETNHFSTYAITEYDHVFGDINNDGNVDNHDIFALFKYLSNIVTLINDKALDINGDGKVNNKDITRLFQFISGYDVILN